MELDEPEYSRRLEQAKYTLKAAENDHNGGFYPRCCFKSQQAAEYALKGLLSGIGEIAAGHSLLKLCSQLGESDINCGGIEDFARKLDRFYIPTRYPDSLPGALQASTTRRKIQSGRWITQGG
jgi:HEPN domain-containing protein